MMVQPIGAHPQDTADPIEEPRAVQGNEPPRAPAPPARGNPRKWRARIIVLLLLAAAVLLFIKISTDRARAADRIDLGTVTLSAQPIPVEVAQTGLVMSVLVTAQQRVAAGQRLGTMEVTSTDSDGDPKVTKVNVTAPRAGVVVDLPATVGSTLQPGQPFLQLYDPNQLLFTGMVPLESLPQIAPSMVATLKGQGIERTVRAKVQRVVPRVGSPDAFTDVNPNAMQVVLVPASARDVEGLVPGLRFTGYVDTVSGVPGSPRLVSIKFSGKAAYVG
jgi:multidrug resistance efflux pump